MVGFSCIQERIDFYGYSICCGTPSHRKFSLKHLCICSNIIVRFNANVHQEHKKLYVGWGSLTDFQLCIENFQFSVQWYDFHNMNAIPCDDKFVWWILMFGYLQLRKWDPGINSPDKLCGKAFSLKGVQCKQWDPRITCFFRNSTCWLNEACQFYFFYT